MRRSCPAYGDTFWWVTDEELVDALHRCASAVRVALDKLDDWGPAGTRPGQYHCDLVADAVAVEVLVEAGLGVMSEESGLHHTDRPVIVALDPVDGSTNASRSLPWYATSACAVDAEGPRAAVVVNQATGERFEAVRGGGARCDGKALAASGCTELGTAIVAMSGWPRRHFGWRQMRALGAAALDLCAVASGRLDAYLDCGNGHGPWDYLGGLLVCREAGAVMADAGGWDLVTLDMDARRAPVAAGTPELLAQVLAARESSG